MKVKFKLTVTEESSPAIQIRHHDKSEVLDQKILEIFITQALEKGIEPVHLGGYFDGKTSWEDYEIRIKQ